jgi:D-3-phosphoglycerate dehydrogenase
VSGRLVVLDAGFGDVAVESEAAAAYDVVIEDAGDVSGAAVVDAAGTADGVLVRYGRIDADLIARCPSWRVIGRYGVGVDNVDVEAATAHGIAVLNVPDYCIEEVATHAAALVLSSTRKLAQAQALIEAGRWNDWDELRPIRPLSECTLGLVGIGRIGGEVVRLLAPFFGRVVAFDPVQAPIAGVEPVDLDKLFAEADVVSLHCPLTPETHNLVDATRLAAMKPDAVLVNVSRGGLIDTVALANALETGSIAGAALDVLPQEPPDPADPLLGAPNLIMTNHLAWYSEVALITLRRLLAARCSAYLNGELTTSVVNARGLAAQGTP